MYNTISEAVNWFLQWQKFWNNIKVGRLRLHHLSPDNIVDNIISIIFSLKWQSSSHPTFPTAFSKSSQLPIQKCQLLSPHLLHQVQFRQLLCQRRKKLGLILNFNWAQLLSYNLAHNKRPHTRRKKLKSRQQYFPFHYHVFPIVFSLSLSLQPTLQKFRSPQFLQFQRIICVHQSSLGGPPPCLHHTPGRRNILIVILSAVIIPHNKITTNKNKRNMATMTKGIGTGVSQSTSSSSSFGWYIKIFIF